MSDRRTGRRELIARTPLFAKLDQREIDALVGVSRQVSIGPRDELCHKGDPVQQIYLVLEGRLKAMTTSGEGDDVVFSIMGPGEVIGEVGLLSGGRRTATVAAIDPSELLAIDRRDFLRVLRTEPEVAVKLLEVLAERLRRISELMEDVQFLNLPSRLAKKLLWLASRYGEPTDGGIRIDLRLSQTELGDLVATTRESVNKQVRDWTQQGVLTMERGFVTLHRPDRLESLAGLVAD
jgi:CRP-like cAMP-binding protein